MKCLHISDLHIGKQLYGYSLLEDQRFVLQQVLDVLKEETPDALFLSGDIYDKPVPSAEAVALFDWFLSEASGSSETISVFVIAGNHDSAKRIDFAGDILRRERVFVVGTPPENADAYISKVSLTDPYGEIDIYMLPFFKPSGIRGVFSPEENESYVNQSKEMGRSEYDIYFEKLMERETIDESRRNVMLTHQFFRPKDETIERTESEIVTVGMLDEIGTKMLAPFDYVAMGHIHKAQKCGMPRYRYCGTVMPYSLGEEKDEKSVTLVTLKEKGTPVHIETRVLKPLRRVRRLRGTKQELLSLEEASNDYVSLIVTDEQPGRFVREELRSVFSHILEIRFENEYMKELIGQESEEPLAGDFFELFSRFYEMRNGMEMSEKEADILTRMLGEVQEVEE